MPSEPRPPLSVRKKLLFSALTLGFFLVLLWVGSLWWRGDQLYRQIMGSARGWSSRIHATDPVLGFVPQAGAESEEVFPIGPPVPTRVDRNSFRIPADDTYKPAADRPLVLALGCSLTFGAACRAEETYPFLVADGLQGRCMNAAACSYGLAQMLLRAGTLIPEYKPDIVIVQYSPWLVDRAITKYAPTYFGKLPVPYFFDDEDGRLEIHPPAFSQSDAPLLEYRDSPRSVGLYCSFLFRAAVPLLIHDDFWGAVTSAKQLFGIAPRPSERRQAIVDQVYGEISELCRAADSRMIVVMLDKGIPPIQRDSLGDIPHATVLDAHMKLAALLPSYDNETFLRTFAHWRGDPLLMVDDHPNPTAHGIIANVILAALESQQ